MLCEVNGCYLELIHDELSKLEAMHLRKPKICLSEHVPAINRGTLALKSPVSTRNMSIEDNARYLEQNSQVLSSLCIAHILRCRYFGVGESWHKKSIEFSNLNKVVHSGHVRRRERTLFEVNRSKIEWVPARARLRWVFVLVFSEFRVPPILLQLAVIAS